MIYCNKLKAEFDLAIFELFILVTAIRKKPILLDRVTGVSKKYQIYLYT